MKNYTEYKIIIFLVIYGVNGSINKTEPFLFKFSRPLDCSESSFYNAKNFSCLPCPDNLISSEDRLECICDENSRYSETNSSNLMCELCEDDSVPTSDKLDCIRCQNNDTCQCLNNEITVERSHNGTLLDSVRCLPCPENSYPSINGNKCLPCIGMMLDDDDNVFSLTALHQRIQKFCLQSNLSIWTNDKRTFEVHFNNLEVDSYYLRSELLLAVHLCEKNHKQSCEHLAHMCLLTLNTNSRPCKFLRNYTDTENYFYKVQNIRDFLQNTTVPPTYTLLTTSPNNKLHFAATVYTLAGKYEAFTDLTSFCSAFNHIQFGVNTIKTCTILAQDLSKSEVKFLVPYLSFFDDSNKKKLLYEVPVLIKNMNEENQIMLEWQLSKKFFTIDSVNGFKALSSSDNNVFTQTSHPLALRYIKSIDIQITLKNGGNPGKIFSPLIVIEYDELTYQDVLSNNEISIDYRVTFSFGDEESNLIIEIILGVFCGLAVIYAVLKTWSYLRKNTTYFHTFTTIFTFFTYLFITVGNALLLICISTCIYYFIFYKGQTVLHILLPNDEFENIIKISSFCAFFGKTIAVLWLLNKHRNLNIFFIDWEQSKSILFPIKRESSRSSLRKNYTQRLRKEKRKLSSAITEMVDKKKRRKRSKSKDPSKSKQRTKKEANRSKKKSSGRSKASSKAHFCAYGAKFDISTEKKAVSIWRTYFVASQWLRIKTKRKTSIWFQIIGTIFVLEVIRLKHWALAVPELSLQPNNSVKKSFVLEYGVGVMIYIVIYIFQWTSTTLYEKHIKNSLQEFVDLCSVANISLFIFSHNYHGYYIHGRSVHGFADTDLLTLINDLEKEEHGLCAHRGLIPGTTDQTFIVCMSKIFRTFYNSLLDTTSTSINNHTQRHLSMVPIWNERWKTYSKLRKFLCGFLDHCYEAIDYTIKDTSFFEKLCNIEFFDTKQSIFYIDNNYSFDTNIFHGNEWCLATFELSVFAFVLAFENGYILSAIFTIFLSQMITFIARFGQNENLAKHTLIDKRFLM